MTERTIERVSDRCLRICGEKRKDCYVNRKEQINCIADMVINKSSGMAMTLRAAMEFDDPEFLRDTVRDSLTSASELMNWVKYLQMVSDLQTLSNLVLDADSSEKRSEIRYPLPEDMEGRIFVSLEDGTEAKLLNYSQSGLMLLTDEPLIGGSVLECTLGSETEETRQEKFRAVVMYSVEGFGSWASGMRVQEVGGSRVFNFFGSVHQLIIDISMSVL